MSIEQLFAPTTNPKASRIIGIPPLVWSPAPERVRMTTPAPDGGEGTTTVDYDGAQLAPREFIIVLTPNENQALSPDARLEVVAIGTTGGRTVIAVLTPQRPYYHLRGPWNQVEVTKDQSTTEYGADLHGTQGSTTSVGT